MCDGHADCPGAVDEEGCNHSNSPIPQHGVNTTSWKLMIVGIVIFAIVVGLVIIIYLVKRKRQPLTESQDVFLACKPLSNAALASASGYTATATTSAPPHHPSQAKTSISGYTGPTGTCSNTYDRDRLTGASSNSSGLLSQHYPYETLNPPPSPVTERDGSSLYSAASSILPPSSYTSSRPHRQHHRNGGGPRGRYTHIPPLPTPCSTDVCDDSESYADDVTPLRRGAGVSVVTARNHINGGIDYDSDSFAYPPHPPPCPTPRSQYFSDPSCPPSPLTERSFNPYPPPPSPVGTSEC